MKNNKKTSSAIRLIVLTIIVALGVLIATTDIVKGEVKDKIVECFNRVSSSGQISLTFPTILAALFAVILCLWITVVISAILKFFGRFSKRFGTAAELIGSILRVVGTILGAIWGLSIIGIDVTVALAGVGIVALVLSLGAQSLVEDIVTGIFIMIEDRINVGDIVVLDDFRGEITSIGARTTVITDTGGNNKIVNNSDIRNIQNRSAMTSLAICDIGISYGSSIPQAEQVIEAAIDKLFEERKDIIISRPKYMGIQSLDDSAVVMRITAETSEENIFAVQRIMNREFKIAIDEAGIEIPFPQVVVHQGKDD